MRWCVLLFLVGCTGSIQPAPYEIAITSSACLVDGGVTTTDTYKGE